MKNLEKLKLWIRCLAFLLICLHQAACYPEKEPPSLEDLPKPQGLRGSSVPMAPQITEQPTDCISLKNDMSVPRLNCRAEGNPDPEITWYKDGSALTHLKERKLVEIKEGLIFIAIQNKGAFPNTGIYQCKARNEYGSALSRNATVEIANIWDDFRLEPSDTLAAVGSSTTIECQGPRGIPEPTISWKKDSSLLTTGGRFQILSGGSLRIDRLKKTDSGSYQCLAANMAGTKESTAAVLMVQEPPQPTIEDPTRAVEVGGSIEVTCQVGGDPRPRISWMRKGGNLPVGRFSSLSDGRMRIDDVEEDDGGEYICIAENRVGRRTARVVVDVQGRPELIEVAENARAEVGDTVTLRCRARGRPKPIVFWRDFRGNEMFVETSYQEGHMLVDANGDLLIFSVRVEDGGVYRCQALNVAGTANADVHLVVETTHSVSGSPPMLTKVPSNTTVLVGATLHLKCHSGTVPKPNIEWLKDGKPLETGQNQHRATKLASGSLEIASVQISDAGQYTCRATNGGGVAEWNAWVKVVADRNDPALSNGVIGEAPSAPGRPVLVNATSFSITISWTDSTSSALSYVIDHYRVQRSSTAWKRVFSNNVRFHRINHLLPSSKYIFVVRSVNQHGVSDPSPPSDAFTTREPTVNKPPEENGLDDVSVTLLNAIYDAQFPGTVTLRWNSSGGCDVIDGFVVLAQAATVSSSALIEKEVHCSKRTYKLPLAEVGPKYEVRIRPYKNQRTGPASPIAFTSSGGGITPAASPSLAVKEDFEHRFIQCRWQPPVDLPAAYVSGYVLNLRSLDGAFERTIHVNRNTTEFTFRNLPAGKAYQSTVTYKTQLGNGTSSEVQQLTLNGEDAFSSLLQNPALIAVFVLAVVMVIAVVSVIGVCCYRKSNRNCKNRNHQASSFNFLSNSGVSRNSEFRSNNGVTANNLSSNDSEQFLMIPTNPAPSNGKPSLYYGDRNCDGAGNKANFSYVTDQLTSMKNIPPQFSRPCLSSRDLEQQLNRQRSETCNNHTPLSYSDPDHSAPVPFHGAGANYNTEEFPPPPTSLQSSTHKTGCSDRSQDSCCVRSISERSSLSGQSSRRLVAPSKLPNLSQSSPNSTDVNCRLHGSQPNYENVLHEDASQPLAPTPPTREESTFPERRYDPERACNQNLEHALSPSKSPTTCSYPIKHPSNHSAALCVSRGNGYGSESDVRESSCEHGSSPSYSSGDESLEMESVSQVGHGYRRPEELSQYYRPPPPQPNCNVNPQHHPYVYISSDQEPLLPHTSADTDEFLPNGIYQSSKHSASNQSSNSSNQKGRERNGSAVVSSGDPSSLNSRSTGTSSQDSGRNSKTHRSNTSAAADLDGRSIDVPESLKLDISNALKRPRLVNGGECPSPSSPTESGISTQSGNISSVSTCWQFQLSSPGQLPPHLQFAPVVNGRLSAPRSSQGTDDRKHFPNQNSEERKVIPQSEPAVSLPLNSHPNPNTDPIPNTLNSNPDTHQNPAMASKLSPLSLPDSRRYPPVYPKPNKTESFHQLNGQHV